MHRVLFHALAIVSIATVLACNVASATVALPDPLVDESLAPAKGTRTAVLAGGCFWGIQAVFNHVKGVTDVKAGYAGGSADTAHYEIVSSGRTGHAESVRIKYDPSQITLGQLLKVFFSVAHDPTELNRQGPDTGTQYRSEIFCANEDQKRIAKAYIDQLNQAKVFRHTIATVISVGRSFYEAEAYHQDYAEHHPTEPYIYINDLPKIASLKKHFPDLYVSKK
ncbi:MAG TPA: peptide-methionine (S)-S-oxide reductase MsrA [Blastocatellia bacterium]|nr:peptide-methionine (S)-S-oxide reductase MsrA [Blastocatellia bacterium]